MSLQYTFYLPAAAYEALYRELHRRKLPSARKTINALMVEVASNEAMRAVAVEQAVRYEKQKHERGEGNGE